MPEQDPKITELEKRLDRLVRTQIDFQKEISLIRGELVRLQARRMTDEEERSKRSLYQPATPETTTTPPESRLDEIIEPVVPKTPQPETPWTPPPPSEATRPRPPIRDAEESAGYQAPRRPPAYESEPILSDATTSGGAFSRFISQYTETARADLEKFVGENLISLIAIVLLIVGVGIGTKYAIDNNWISPLTRIVLGYVFGFSLVGLAIKLKSNYHNFSAVLISGGMAIMYFVTFFAYSAYGLIGQLQAFGLMVMFTAVTVAAALWYNRQVIAHIGLVGAYAVPFLLSSDSGNYLALFIYMSVINIGILAISLKKSWAPIFYTSSAFTWIIFGGWLSARYSADVHLYLGLSFLGIFFLIFYGAKVAQTGLLAEEKDNDENLISSVLTSAIFYFFCFSIGAVSLPAGQHWTFFSYLAVAAVVILATSFRFQKPAFAFWTSWLATWAIFYTWFVRAYAPEEHFQFALIFLGVFFALFYGTKLIQTRFIEDDNDRNENLISAFFTAVVLYAGCFAIVQLTFGDAAYWTLFSYIAAASVLILATSFRFYGRAFIYLVIPFAWIIYGSWFFARYDPAQHFDLAAVFISTFFAIFYFSILYHRLIEDNFRLVEHTSLILSNAFVAYGFGYLILDRSEALNGYLGLYTAANAVLHLAVALIVNRVRRDAVDVVQVLTILILTFASLAVPVQFDGNVVTMVWATEAAMLFWFGRTRRVTLFEYFSYPVMVLATGSMFFDWFSTYNQRVTGDAGPLRPFANSDFITAIVFVVAFAFIYLTMRDRNRESGISELARKAISYMVAGVGLFVLYNMFRAEIGNYFHLQSVNAYSGSPPAPWWPVGDLGLFNVIWQINYTLLFFAAMAVVNLRKLRSSSLAVVNILAAVLTIPLFLSVSMFLFNELRLSYVAGSFDPVFVTPLMYVAVRPISYLFLAGLLYCLYEYSRDALLTDRVRNKTLTYLFDAVLYPPAFIVASCELVNLMGQFGIPDSTKLGLSILWGVYALVMIVIGIARHKKHLRITAIVLLAVTLAKLFLYDIAELDTIPKTILFVTLGITMLVVSFLYNKYKGVIFNAEAVEDEIT